MNIIFDENGVADVYDDTYDIVIHCESEEDQKDARLALKNVRRWIPVAERLPEEHDSIFARLNGTEKWRNGMFRRRSDNVLVTVKYEDGTVHTEQAHTTDGVWKTDYKVKEGKVVAWMPFPEPYKGDAE